MELLIFGAIAVTLLGSLILVLVLRARSERAGGVDAWREAARRVGGEFREDVGEWDEWRIEAVIGGHRVVVGEHGTDMWNTTTETAGYTRVTALADSGSDLRLLVTPREVFVSTTGLEPVTTGDAAFDARFEAAASDAQLGRAWLSGAARAALLQAAGYRVEVNGERVLIECSRLETQSDPLVAAMHAAGALAEAGSGRCPGLFTVAPPAPELQG